MAAELVEGAHGAFDAFGDGDLLGTGEGVVGGDVGAACWAVDTDDAHLGRGCLVSNSESGLHDVEAARRDVGVGLGDSVGADSRAAEVGRGPRDLPVPAEP